LTTVAQTSPRAGPWAAAGAAKRLLLGPCLPSTWRMLASLIASLATAAAFAAVLLAALAAGLAWLPVVAVWLAVLGVGRTGRLLWRVVRRSGASGKTRRPPTKWGALVWLSLVALTMRVSARLAGLDRARTRNLTGSQIPDVPWPRVVPGLAPAERQRAWLESAVVRRGALYQIARLPVIVAIGTAVAGACALMTGGLAGASWPGGYLGHSASVPIGIAAVFLWPVVVGLGSAIDVALARALLGPSRTGQLTAEVEHLGAARANAVESADTERRRIERDLHDGLQPRLVSLALELGIARSRFERDPDYARYLLEQAHEEAKIAIQDLRSLVRGIHPSVLDERGLDAALSALVASCAVPVRVAVSLTRRPDRPQEAVAYFVVAEAITNMTKHSSASAATVTITDNGSQLRVLVADDGKGGAAIEPGGGLAGLAARVSAIDGTLTVTSPPGGPTQVAAVLPYAR
jgi:signal transduction histidine kinase